MHGTNGIITDASIPFAFVRIVSGKPTQNIGGGTNGNGAPFGKSTATVTVAATATTCTGHRSNGSGVDERKRLFDSVETSVVVNPLTGGCGVYKPKSALEDGRLPV